MRRTLPVCALLSLLPLASHAAGAAEPTETVIRMTVSPASAPKPVLKYQLLPELREMNPGNPIQGYSKCFAEQYNFWRNKEEVEKREKWQTMPLKELPLQQMQYFRGNPLRYADYAARLDTPDWQILLQLKSDGPTLLLPDIQGLRELAGALKVRFRMEVAEQRLDAALATAKTMFALSRHLGEHPTLIGELVGIAVANLAIGPLDEMIQQPGAPNLFWALTDLPHPFIDLRKGAQGERVMLAREFALLNDREAMTETQLRKVIDHYGTLVRGFGNVRPEGIKKAETWLRERVGNAEYLDAARRRLIEYGLAAEAVAKFPNLQVVLLDQRREVEIWRDEVTKALVLPYWQASPVLDTAPGLKMDLGNSFFAMLPRKVKMAQARLDQRLGLLRCVEALRIYAAENEGKLPAKLDDIKLPLPVDPITGKPFGYKLDGATAILRGTPPPGQEKVAAYNVRYEVTIHK